MKLARSNQESREFISEGKRRLVPDVSTSNSTRLERDKREYALVEQKKESFRLFTDRSKQSRTTKSKAEVDAITNQLFESIDVDEYPEDSDI